MEMMSSTSSVVLLLFCFLSASLLIPSTALGFNCTTTKPCSALIDYVSRNTTTLGNIAHLFGVSNMSLFLANSFPFSTSPVQTVEVNQTIKIPFQCNCGVGIGISNKVSMYMVKKGEYLIEIASEVFFGLVTYQDIATVNDISNANSIENGQKLWIPLPCNCDKVEDDWVVHYGHVVAKGSSLGQIAKEYGTSQRTLSKLNGIGYRNELRAGQLIDVPLQARACSSTPECIFVPNGTEVLNLNNDCLHCTCESSDYWKRPHCELSQGDKPYRWTASECPSMMCQGGLVLGKTVKSLCAMDDHSSTRTIFTTLNDTFVICDYEDSIIFVSGKKFAPADFIPAGIGIVATVIVLCCLAKENILLYCCLRWKPLEDNENKDIDVESFLRNNGSFGPKRYSYSDIMKMTDSFKDKLGEGGYGSVFKGNLLDGSMVAVKILKESRGNGEEFINEIASISRTSHVNIVALFGYCFEGIRRALVYEFMPNGSLDKFIYDEESSITNPRLGWQTLSNIAIGIARGLEYLHRGCNTRILHFDIKPHNILLDQDFCPKISDFGLAKLCPRKESIVSMPGMRGTIGYIAPEVFCRNFGGVSHKSNVYCYGMMVLEMVGGRKNVKVSVDHTSEIYFPHWIYKHFQQDQELGPEGLITIVEEDIARKMTIVGLWCIQTDPLNRPSMSKVVEMLEGSITSLQIPPKPYLSSPPRSPDSSTTTLENSEIT